MNGHVVRVDEKELSYSQQQRAAITAHFNAMLFLHRRYGNTFSVSRTLVLLYVAMMYMESRPVYLKDIAGMLGVCMSAASRLMIRFLSTDVTSQIGYGLIEQRPDCLDRRKSRLQLTRKGHQLIANYLDKAIEYESRSQDTSRPLDRCLET